MNKYKQLTESYVVRGSVVTAVASLTTGTPTTLISGDTDYLLDLVEIRFANDSAATSVVLKDDGTTVGTFAVPISTAQSPSYRFEIPLPQSAIAGRWYLDMPDLTGTTIDAYATFIKRSKNN